MSSKITIDELEKYLWGSAVLLRTHVDAGAYKQYIFPLLFFKRLSDVYDEECEKVRAEFGEEALDWEENHQLQIPDGAHWNDVRNVSQDVGKAIIEAFHKIETANPEKLHGIFGEASWTNKNRLPDRLLKDMLEHFSTKTLSIANCPADELGQGYEYLIKQFADDSGHTAQEFYTNRTVVNLMTEMLKPQPGESIYDPTCGSAGMLISAVAYLKQQGLEWRNLSIYGQEIVTLTSAIARMNLLLHGVQDFNIVNADTLGTPPQGRADYAFFQHILKSLDEKTGRCAILFPHGVLFRNEEKDMREKLVKSDLVECVIGLGPNLFYNSPMEACIIICRTRKAVNRKGQVLFINALNEVTRKNAQSYLEDKHIEKIAKAYDKYESDGDIAKVVTIKDIAKNDYSLSIPLYIQTSSEEKEDDRTVQECYSDWKEAAEMASRHFESINEMIGGYGNGNS